MIRLTGKRKRQALLARAAGHLEEMYSAEVVIVDGKVVKCRYEMKNNTILVYGKSRCIRG
jgi:hypothetical protein